MNISKFKLIDNGLTGISVSGTEIIIKDGVQSINVDTKERTYKVPVPIDITSLIQSLRFHFLMITKLLPLKCKEFFDNEFGLYKLLDYKKSFDRDLYAFADHLMNSLLITGFSHTENGIVITGKMKGIDDLTFAINTPLYSLDSDNGEVDTNMIKTVIQIKKAINEFVDGAKFRKMAPKQYLLELFKGNEEKIEEIKTMPDEEAEKLQVEKLQEKGYIVFKAEEVMSELLEENNTTGMMPDEPENKGYVPSINEEEIPEEMKMEQEKEEEKEEDGFALPIIPEPVQEQKTGSGRKIHATMPIERKMAVSR